MKDEVEILLDLDKLSNHYDELALRHGHSPLAVQQSNIETLLKRQEVLLDAFPDIKNKKVLDFGCGTGHLFQLLQQRGFEGEYVGFDISEKQIDIANATHKNARFSVRNILTQGIDEEFDYCFISGVFNNLLSDNKMFFESVLKIIWPTLRNGIAFNCLSNYVDYKSEGLYYFDPSYVFDFCKTNLTTNVSLRHNYQVKPDVFPFEFSVYLYKSPFSLRKKLND